MLLRSFAVHGKGESPVITQGESGLGLSLHWLNEVITLLSPGFCRSNTRLRDWPVESVEHNWFLNHILKHLFCRGSTVEQTF